LEQAIVDLNQLYIDKYINVKQIKKLCKLFRFQFLNEKFEMVSEDHNFPQALWIRGADGVSTCSNHSERINRTCNAKTKSLQNITDFLYQIIDIILEKLAKTISSRNR
jgi:hypothetical protein